jgi:phage-related protein
LFEIHAKGQAGIARVFFRTIKNNTIVILHIFTKKTEKTPKRLGFGAENNERGKKL